MRHRRLHVLTIAAACAIGVGVFAPVPVANSATQGADEVGPQGIVIVPEGHDQVVPEGFRDVYAALDALTEIYPTDFGYVSPNITGTPVESRCSRRQAVRSWLRWWRAGFPKCLHLLGTRRMLSSSETSG